MKLLTALLLTLPLLGCDNDGAAERAGEEIDETVEDVRAGGETVGNRIDDAVDDTREAAEDVRDELEND